MPQAVNRARPSAAMRLALRAPIWLYRSKLGFLLGKRFMLLKHVGRKSGKLRETVLEVVAHDPESGSITVASGFGIKADWLRNIQASPEVDITVGNTTRRARASVRPLEEAIAILQRYANEHPRAFRGVAKFSIGEALSPSDADIRRMAEVVPIVTFSEH